MSPTIGFDEDGYQAIQFAIDNVPFRNDPRIARNILLITDEGRTAIPQGDGLTFESIQVEGEGLTFEAKTLHLGRMFQLIT